MIQYLWILTYIRNYFVVHFLHWSLELNVRSVIKSLIWSTHITITFMHAARLMTERRNIQTLASKYARILERHAAKTPKAHSVRCTTLQCPWTWMNVVRHCNVRCKVHCAMPATAKPLKTTQSSAWYTDGRNIICRTRYNHYCSVSGLRYASEVTGAQLLLNKCRNGSHAWNKHFKSNMDFPRLTEQIEIPTE